MVAINPQLRISPSGAEAIGSTNPFSDYSGFAFTALNSTQNDSEVLAPIGPQGSSTDAFITFEAGTALTAAPSSTGSFRTFDRKISKF